MGVARAGCGPAYRAKRRDPVLPGVRHCDALDAVDGATEPAVEVRVREPALKLGWPVEPSAPLSGKARGRKIIGQSRAIACRYVTVEPGAKAWWPGGEEQGTRWVHTPNLAMPMHGRGNSVPEPPARKIHSREALAVRRAVV